MKQPDLKPKDDLENLKQITSSSLTENLFSIKSSFNDNLPLRKTGLVIMPKPKNDAVVSATNDDMKFSPDTDYRIDEAVEIFSTFPKSDSLSKEADDEIQTIPNADLLVSKTDEVISSSPERKILEDKQGQETTSSSSVITLVSKAEEKITLSPDNDATIYRVEGGICSRLKEKLPRKASY